MVLLGTKGERASNFELLIGNYDKTDIDRFFRPKLSDCYQNKTKQRWTQTQTKRKCCPKQVCLPASRDLAGTELKGGHMYAAERYRSIVERVRGMGRASVSDLADDLAVTPETIRRDLSVLERQGLVRRVHGGAVATERVAHETTIDSRNAVLVEEKNRIAKAALLELPNEGTVLIDAGSTTGRLVSMIPDDRNLTVVTDSLTHALMLAGRPNISLLMLGGRVRESTMACVEQWALDALSSIFVDVVIMGTNGISLDRGLTTPDSAEAQVKAAMLKSARRKVLLADHSKFETNSFARFGELNELDLVITDFGLDEATALDYAAAGINLVRA